MIDSIKNRSRSKFTYKLMKSPFMHGKQYKEYSTKRSNRSSIVASDFNNNYNEFMNYLSKLVIDGYSISASAGSNSEAYMYTKRNSFFHKISLEEIMHVI